MRVYQFRHIRADGQCSHLFPDISRHGRLSGDGCRRSVSESMTSPPAHGDGRTIFLIDGWSAFRRSLRLFVEAAGYRVVGEADSLTRSRCRRRCLASRRRGHPRSGPRRGSTLGDDLAKLRSASRVASFVLLTAEPLRSGRRATLHAGRQLVPDEARRSGRPAERARRRRSAGTASCRVPSVMVLHRPEPSSHAAVPYSDHILTQARAGDPLACRSGSFKRHGSQRCCGSPHSRLRFHLTNIFRKLRVRNRVGSRSTAEHDG